MDFELSEPEKKFRDEVRGWLKANKPRDNGSMAEGQKTFIDSRRAWQKKLYDAGYVGITWPKENGGRRAGFMEKLIFNPANVPAQTPQTLHPLRPATSPPLDPPPP